jgi:hypothetical protein
MFTTLEEKKTAMTKRIQTINSLKIRQDIRCTFGLASESSYMSANCETKAIKKSSNHL